jgi:hypothetical protein
MTNYEHLSRCIACVLSFLRPQTLVRDEVWLIFTRHVAFLGYTYSILRPTDQYYEPNGASAGQTCIDTVKNDG